MFNEFKEEVKEDIQKQLDEFQKNTKNSRKTTK